jgi:hypothetical protein
MTDRYENELCEAVVPEQLSVHVGVNTNGDILIQQPDIYGDVQFVWFKCEHAKAVADAILRQAKIAEMAK